MAARAVFDLHCDTLTALMSSGRRADTLDDPDSAFSLSRIPRGLLWAQCCAVFVPDGLSPGGAAACCDLHRRSFLRQAEALPRARACRTAEEIRRVWAEEKTALILTVENGAALAGRLDRLAELAGDGMRMMTLTWNGENELGAGNAVCRGLSPFGRSVVREMERLDVVPDVSHLNDAGFRDVLETARRPFAASHSNARAVCPHPRNLADWQIREMAGRGCLIGLNYYSPFLRDDGRPAGLDDLCRHAGHILSLGGENCLALGSDFDGATMPPCLDRCDRVPALVSVLEARFGRELAEKIAWRNALAFFSGGRTGPPA